jgi:hypothetical protein
MDLIMTQKDKIKKAEELIFSFSETLWSEPQVKSRVDAILDLQINFNLINPAQRDENRNPQQWFLDLLNYTNLGQWEAAHDDGFNHVRHGNWVNNAVSMAVALLPYIGPIKLLELDGKEHKPTLNYGKEIGQWNISTSRTDDKDILDVITDDIFTKYNILPKEHFFTLLENVLGNCTLSKEQASSVSYRIMLGDDHHNSSSIYDSRFTDKELARAYTALINATPNFSKDDIGWRIKGINRCPETLATIETLILKNNLDQSLSNNKESNIKKSKV